jgi:hypothetical protein
MDPHVSDSSAFSQLFVFHNNFPFILQTMNSSSLIKKLSFPFLISLITHAVGLKITQQYFHKFQAIGLPQVIQIVFLVIFVFQMINTLIQQCTSVHHNE